MWKLLERIFNFFFKDPYAHDDVCYCVPKAPGKLNGKRILIDPGHGLYRKTINGSGTIYVYQQLVEIGRKLDQLSAALASGANRRGAALHLEAF